MSVIHEPRVFDPDPKRTVGKGDYYHTACKGCNHPFSGGKRDMFCQICLDKSDEKTIPVWVVMDRLTYEVVKILYRRQRPFSWEAWAVYAGISVDEAVTAYVACNRTVSQEEIDKYDNVRLIP